MTPQELAEQYFTFMTDYEEYHDGMYACGEWITYVDNPEFAGHWFHVMSQCSDFITDPAGTQKMIDDMKEWSDRAKNIMGAEHWLAVVSYLDEDLARYISYGTLPE